MKFPGLVLMMASNLLLSNSLKCYTCEKNCGPQKTSWKVQDCTGSCREEFWKHPGNNNKKNIVVVVVADNSSNNSSTNIVVVSE